MQKPRMTRIAMLSLFLYACACATGQMQLHRQVVPAARPPASTLPTAATRQSTALAAAARTGIARPKELPALTVVDQDGKALDLHAQSRAHHWLLLYRQAVCAPCDKLMSSLEQDASFQHGAAVTVIVNGASAATLAKTQAQFSQWSQAAWAADASGSAFQSLKMKGTPMLYGLDGPSIVFALAGAPGSADQATTKAAGTWVAATPVAETSVAASSSPAASTAAGAGR